MPQPRKREQRKDLSDRDLEWLEAHEAEVEKAREKLEARAKKLGVKIDQLQDDRGKTQAQAKDKAKREKELEEAIAKARRDDLWTTRACVDGATTWLGLRLVLATVNAKAGIAIHVNAADRTSHADDCGDKMSQAELYYGFVHGLPGFFPANPPGTGSHEGVCDDDLAAVGFGSIGSHLKAYQWGLDLSDGARFQAEANKLGFAVVRAYGNEAWHCNVKADPTPVLRTLHAI
jgi:hypothetical protein